MKRDMDLVREILLHIEAIDEDPIGRGIILDKYDFIQIGYHLRLMSQANLVEIEVFEVFSSDGDVFVKRLTWNGHEFLDVARDQEVWNEARQQLQATGGGTLSIWLEVLQELTTKKLESLRIQKAIDVTQD